MRSSVFIFTASLVAGAMATVHETTTKNATHTVTLYYDEQPWSMCSLRCAGELLKLGGEDKTGCKYTKSKFAPDDPSCTCTDEKSVRVLSSCLTRRCAEEAPGAETMIGLLQLFFCKSDFNVTLNMDAWGAGIEEAEKEGVEVDQTGWTEEKKERRKAAEELVQKKVAKYTEALKETIEEKAEEAKVEETTEEKAEEAKVEETTEEKAEEAKVEETTEEKAEEAKVEETNDEEKGDDDTENAAGKSVVGMGVTTGAASMVLLLAGALL